MMEKQKELSEHSTLISTILSRNNTPYVKTELNEIPVYKSVSIFKSKIEAAYFVSIFLVYF